jgi:hypothetical protein
MNQLKLVILREYDLKDAGFSIIKNNNLLDNETLEYLSSLDKYSKNVEIGKIIREKPEVSKCLMNKFIEIRKKFAKINELKEEDILSIKKDAIFIINKRLKFLEFDNYCFSEKNKYSSYFYVNKKEFYYSSWEDKLDIKGINKETKKIHEKFLLRDIKNIIKQNETLNNIDIVKCLKFYRNLYLNRELEFNCYREMNSNNLYRLKFLITGSSVFSNEVEDANLIDITHNYVKYIVPFISLIV